MHLKTKKNSPNNQSHLVFSGVVGLICTFLSLTLCPSLPGHLCILMSQPHEDTIPFGGQSHFPPALARKWLKAGPEAQEGDSGDWEFKNA